MTDADQINRSRKKAALDFSCSCLWHAHNNGDPDGYQLLQGE